MVALADGTFCLRICRELVLSSSFNYCCAESVRSGRSDRRAPSGASGRHHTVGRATGRGGKPDSAVLGCQAADGRRDVRRENDPPDRFLAHLTIAHLFMARIKDDVPDLAKRPFAAQACNSWSSSLVAQLTRDDDRLSMPNSRMTASTSRVARP